jgi:DDE domain
LENTWQKTRRRGEVATSMARLGAVIAVGRPNLARTRCSDARKLRGGRCARARSGCESRGVSPSVTMECKPVDHEGVAQQDHGRLKARLRPMRGLKRDHTARVIIRGHALMQNIRRGHYELGIEARHHRRVGPRSPNSPEPSEQASTTTGSRTMPSKSTQQSLL